jgi:hypothetical protein
MPATDPAVATRDEFTVAGLIRRLAHERPGDEMLVAGDERGTAWPCWIATGWPTSMCSSAGR